MGAGGNGRGRAGRSSLQEHPPRNILRAEEGNQTTPREGSGVMQGSQNGVDLSCLLMEEDKMGRKRELGHFYCFSPFLFLLRQGFSIDLEPVLELTL